FPIGTPLNDDLLKLANHVWENRYAQRTQDHLRRLRAITNLPPATEWGSTNKVLLQSRALAEEIKGDRLLNRASVGQAQASELEDRHRRIIALSIEQKPAAILLIMNATLENGAHKKQYFGQSWIDYADFQSLDAFQAAAIDRITQRVSPEAIKAEAERLSKYLSQQSKKAIDQRYSEVVRNELFSDGRITLEEISGLRKL
ncbi:MAG: hypothetical protein NWS01_11050, partial [Burkholderiales bacterium]|nr:hypothetical protein [Burkholderiales bacterium]